MKALLRPVRALATLLLYGLQAMTGVAGFWLRRQWGAATIVASLLIILWMLITATRYLLHLWLRAHLDLLELPASFIAASTLYLLLVGAVLIWSLWLLRGARRLTSPSWGAHAVTAVTLGVAAVVMTWRQLPDDYRLLSFYLKRGGIWLTVPGQHVVLRTGVHDFERSFSVSPCCANGWIVGQVLYQGQPVKAAVELYYGDYYRSPAVWSDAQGIFQAPAPTGTWPLGKILLRRWQPPSPDEEYTLLWHDTHGQTPAVQSTFFNHVDYVAPLMVEAREQQAGAQLTLNIRPHIKMLWPLADKIRQPAAIAHGVIAWQPVADAYNYKIAIGQITRDSQDNSASGSLSLERTSREPRLELSSLPWSSATEGDAEYYVNVMAYDRSGSLLSFSREAFSSTSFIIKDSKRLPSEFDSAIECQP